MNFSPKSIAAEQKPFDAREFIGRQRVIIVYGTLVNKYQKKLEKDGFLVKINPMGYRDLLMGNGMIVLGLDGLVKYAGRALTYGEVTDLRFRDKIQSKC